MQILASEFDTNMQTIECRQTGQFKNPEVRNRQTGVKIPYNKPLFRQQNFKNLKADNTLEQPGNNMKNIIDRQILTNKNLNLLFNQLDSAIRIDKTFRETLIKLKRGNEDVSELIDHTVRKTLETIYRINQYLELSKEDITTLKRIYEETWEELREENIAAIIRSHHQKLSTWIARFYPPDFISALENKQSIGHVLNEEYTAAFQLALFDINPDELAEPIIDIGCGKNGLLVKAISRVKKNVTGIDRLISDENELLLENDWFEFYFEVNHWGTIIANMSFSNHLLYTFTNDQKNLYRYFAKYKEIIESLKIDGTFIYAPSIPFIEDRLDPESYVVTRKEVAVSHAMTKIKRVS